MALSESFKPYLTSTANARFLEVQITKRSTESRSEVLIADSTRLPFADGTFTNTEFTRTRKCLSEIPTAFSVEAARVTTANLLDTHEFYLKNQSHPEESPFLIGKIRLALGLVFNKERQREWINEILAKRSSKGVINSTELPEISDRLKSSSGLRLVPVDVGISMLLGLTGNFFAASFGLNKIVDGLVNQNLNLWETTLLTGVLFWAAPLIPKMAYSTVRGLMEAALILRDHQSDRGKLKKLEGNHINNLGKVALLNLIPGVSWFAQSLLTDVRNEGASGHIFAELKDRSGSMMNKFKNFFRDPLKDTANQIAIKKVKAENVLVLLTPGIGKGNLSYLIIIKAWFDKFKKEGYTFPFSDAAIVLPDRLLHSVAGKIHFSLINNLHKMVASNEIIAGLYTIITAFGGRKSNLLGKSFIEPIFKYISKSQLVIATSADAALSLVSDGFSRVMLMQTDTQFRDSAVNPGIAGYLFNNDSSREEMKARFGRRGDLFKDYYRRYFLTGGFLTHPIVVNSFLESNERRRKKFTNENTTSLNLLDISSGSGPEMKRCKDVIKGCSDEIISGRINIGFWFGTNLNQAKKLYAFAKEHGLPCRVIDGRTYAAAKNVYDDTSIMFGLGDNKKSAGSGVTIICDQTIERAVELLYIAEKETDVGLGTADETTFQLPAGGIPKIIYQGYGPEIKRKGIKGKIFRILAAFNVQRGTWEKANMRFATDQNEPISTSIYQKDRARFGEIIEALRGSGFRGVTLEQLRRNTLQYTNTASTALKILQNFSGLKLHHDGAF